MKFTKQENTYKIKELKNKMDNDIIENKTEGLLTSIAKQTEEEIWARMENGLMKCDQCCARFPLPEMRIVTCVSKTSVSVPGLRIIKLSHEKINKYLCRLCGAEHKGGC